MMHRLINKDIVNRILLKAAILLTAIGLLTIAVSACTRLVR